MHADPACVGGAHERHERLVAAEQRVDVVERRRVVAVRRARREERRQVEDDDAEPLEVVEVRLDARRGRRRTTRAACRAPTRSGCRPSRAAPPSRAALARRPERAKRSGKTWYTTPSRCQPGPSSPDGAHEVVGVGHVVADEPAPVTQRVADVAAGEQPAVRRRRVEDAERRAPPRLVVALLVDLGDGDVRLAVGDVAQRRPRRPPTRGGRGGAPSAVVAELRPARSGT